MLKTLSSRDYPASYYAATANTHPPHPTIQGDHDCDVCVIGGGYTGLNAALALAEKGYDVILLESSRIGWGASGRNGGQVGSAHTVFQADLIRKYGDKNARALWDITENAKTHLKNLIIKHDIKCDYVSGNLGCSITSDDLDYFKEHVEITQSYGYEHYEIFKRQKTTEITGSAAYSGGIYDPTAGHLHPLNLALGYADACLKAGVKIFEMSPARDIKKTNPAIVETDSGQVRSKFVLLGCNGYLGRLNYQMGKKILPADNYQLTTEPLPTEIVKKIMTNKTCIWDIHKQV